MSKPTKDPRGRRYSPAEKAQVLDFIAKVNREQGGGGQAAAHQKFGIANVTLKLWMQQGPLPADHKATARTLLRLQVLAEKITTLEEKLARLHSRYEHMKAES